MQKVFIEDGLSLYNKTGIGQYTENLISMLNEIGCDVVAPRKYFMEKVKNASIKRFLYVLWLNVIFPFLFIFSGAQKVIFTNYLTPLYKIPTKKYYSAIYDLSAIKYPETMNKAKKDYQTWILKVTKNTFYKIITDSKSAKKDIIDYFKCADDAVSVIYPYFSFGEKPSINYSKNEESDLLHKYNINNKEYILSVGSLNKRKNIQALIDAYNEIKIDKKLLIVGNDEGNKFNNINNSIIFTGYISDEDLKVLYKNALLFVFPSIYEGFGIPLIDAQSFGIPVLCSDIEVFREIGQDSIEYFSLASPQNLAEKIEKLILDNRLRQDLINKGFDNIKNFSINIIKESLKNAIM